MRSAEEIINELQSAYKKQGEVMGKIESLTKELKNLDKTSWEWISVKKASEMMDISPAVLYAKINAGILNTKRIESKIYLNVNELKSINDLDNMVVDHVK